MIREARKGDLISPALHAELSRVFEHSKISRAELARRLGVTPGAVTRYLSGDTVPSVPILERWLVACGAVWRIETPDALVADLVHAASRLDAQGLRTLTRVALAWSSLTAAERDTEALVFDVRAARSSPAAAGGNNPGPNETSGRA